MIFLGGRSHNPNQLEVNLNTTPTLTTTAKTALGAQHPPEHGHLGGGRRGVSPRAVGRCDGGRAAQGSAAGGVHRESFFLDNGGVVYKCMCLYVWYMYVRLKPSPQPPTTQTQTALWRRPSRLPGHALRAHRGAGRLGRAAQNPEPRVHRPRARA